MASRVSEHDAPLAAVGIPPAVRPLLSQYLDLVQRWNERTNLTGARTASERVRVLVSDAWRAAPLVRGTTLIDVGSGNGSPGLVLALVRPELQVTLLEPRARRWAFLREVARSLGRADVVVARCRASEFGEAADAVTLRAVGLSLTEVAGLVRPGGQVLVFGGEPVEEGGFRRLARHPLEGSFLHEFQRGG